MGTHSICFFLRNKKKYPRIIINCYEEVFGDNSGIIFSISS